MIGRRSRARRAAVIDLLTDGERRRLERGRADACALLGDGPGSSRVATALPAYVLAHASSDLARHCEMLDPLPRAGEVRLSVTPTSVARCWHLDLVTRDRPGLLAAFSGVLAATALDVTQAVLTTWPDGAALQAFTVRAATDMPAQGDLQRALSGALGLPLQSDPVPGASVRFDDDASALYTACEVAAPDQPGLLHAIAVAIAAAGGDVHAASVRTHERIAHDHFDLSDRSGQKLDHALQHRIAERLRTGTGRAGAGLVRPAEARTG
jgi:UTP:GlnB (protein PII) uridylyltransferase